MTPSCTVTLPDVVHVVSAYATPDKKVVVTVAHPINSGLVLLCGAFAKEQIDLSVPPAFLSVLQQSPPPVTPLEATQGGRRAERRRDSMT